MAALTQKDRTFDSREKDGIQSFADRGDPEGGTRHLAELREELRNMGLDGFIVPHEDEYLNEYLPPDNERLAWLTGFAGSAGSAVALSDGAAIFVDGRYAIQVHDQVNAKAFDIVIVESREQLESALAAFLSTRAEKGSRIGYDPKLHSSATAERIQSHLSPVGARLVPTPVNPLDLSWGEDRPAPTHLAFRIHPLDVAGETSASKRASIAREMVDAGTDAALITAPASIAWLFNIRGLDVPRTPVALANALLYSSGKAEFFANAAQVSPAISDWLGSEVTISTSSALPARLERLRGQRVLIDPAASSAWHTQMLHSAGIEPVSAQDPCELPRACKNAVEIEGARKAHVHDGIALTRFLHWFDSQADKTAIDEIAAARALERFRRDTGALQDLAFDTIAGAGPNAAIVHYQPTVTLNRQLEMGSVLLVDSGGQYLSGTTDVTRTVAIGAPSAEIRTRFTLALKGFLALAHVRFPPGTSGIQLDVLARAALWAAGLDYDHGTGHGVGSYLAVHEGPQRISKISSSTPLRAGMILSNEPGYYKAGAYGLRIENLQLVTEATPIAGGERPMHGFEALTLAPIDRHLIAAELLTPEECRQLDAYHARVLALLAAELDPEVAAWLTTACAPILENADAPHSH
jgi:Xaa-Pro aminopeptidase